MDDVFVRLVQLPDGIRGFCMKGVDNYSIYIDSRLDRESMLRTYEHELRHIKNGDFEKSDVQQIEYEAHKKSPCCGTEGSPKEVGS